MNLKKKENLNADQNLFKAFCHIRVQLCFIITLRNCKRKHSKIV